MLKLLRIALSNINTKYFERNERDFSYELYHQIRILKLPKETEVTCESSKKRFSINDTILNNKLIKRCFFSNGINENSRIYRYPDLLIHEYDNMNQQLIAVEIKKRVDPTLIKRDLAKLVVYCKGLLNYKSGVLIIINPNDISRIIEMPDIREMLKLYPEVQIWIAKPNKPIEIICKETLNKY